ncbi:MAG: glycosyltransferase family 2 protein [Verrucomicrobiota bacterium]
MKISIVTPFYNEEEALSLYFDAVIGVLEDRDFEIVCVDDGSRDRTLEGLLAKSEADERIRVVELSRNFGKEAALSAGLSVSRGDAVIILDADLQDPPSLIPKMIEEWEKGHDVVLAQRSHRGNDSLMKRTSAAGFYKIFNRFAEVPIPENVGDFRLIDRKVLHVVNQFSESNRFMKGLLSWPGFRTTTIQFERPERAAGQTKWNYRALIALSIDGILAFSELPLRLAVVLGLFSSLGAIIYAIYTIIKTFVFGADVPGYPSLLVVNLTLSGLILICLGIIGEYIGRIYREAKGRPIFVIRELYEKGRKR